MPQQEHRKAGEPLPCQLPPGIEVLHRPVPAAPGSEVQPGRPRRHGETVPQVVVARHGKAPLRQVGRQGLIPQDVLRHAMGEHQNRPGCHVRRPLHRMDAGPPVCGGEGKFVSHHGKIILSVLYCVPSGVGCLLSGSMIPHFRHKCQRRPHSWKHTSLPWTREPPAPGPSCSTGPGRSSPAPSTPSARSTPSPAGWSTIRWKSGPRRSGPWRRS